MSSSHAKRENRPEPSARSFAPPTQFDEYRLLEPLGRGRGGRVFLAHDTLLDRTVAVKFIPSPDGVWLTRFLVEARAAARVQHPNVVTLYRVGQHEDLAYLISEYVRGTGLDRLEKPVDARRMLGIATDLARGLAAAHRCGVLHRDLKPANAILAETGEVKLFDFGLAKLFERPAPALSSSGGSSPPPSWSAGLDLGSEDALSGALVGTPYFIAPEIWRGEGATVQSDLFSLGILLYELCSGQGPYRDVPLRSLVDVVPTRDARTLNEVAPGIDPRLAAAIDRCIRRDPRERFANAEALLDVLEAIRPTALAELVPDGNPYRGLQAFEAEHRSLFFGRRRETRLLLERLRSESFLLVTGDSGVGKSSLCLAGALPAITEGGLLDARSWQIARMIPGRRPLAALASCVAPRLKRPEQVVEDQLATDPAQVARALRRAQGPSHGLVLYVDQLEELITLTRAPDADQAARALGELAMGYGGLKLIASARSDFLTRLAQLPGLGELVPRSLYLLRGLSVEETREAIVGPALLKGGRFASEALVEALVRSSFAAEGGLPLLQFALAELWETRTPATNEITPEGLERIGGVAGALARHADQVIGQLLPDERRLARVCLLRLVTVEGTRARRSATELVGEETAVKGVLESLVRGRLLVARDDAEGGHLEIAHEALISGWGTLARWLAEDAETRALVQRVEQAAAEWVRLGHKPDALWRGSQLADAAALSDEALGPREREFLRASRRGERRQRRFRRVAAVAFVGSLCLVYGAVKLRARLDRADQVRALMVRAKGKLESARKQRDQLQAQEREAFRLFDLERREQAEAVWKQVVRGREQVSLAFGGASRDYEEALALDPSSSPVRVAFADLLFERTLLMEHQHRSTDTKELLQRLQLFDDGSRLARWNAPGHVRIHVSPSDARLELHVYAPDESGRIQEKPSKVLAAGDVELAPGDYVLVASAPDRVTVREAFLLARGERLPMALTLPPASGIPPGFVYVPPGRFLFGSGADESIREFFNTAPMHAVETGGFLIGQHEVTFGEWLEYLQALPAPERARRTPRVGLNGISGGDLDLRQTAKGWRITLSPGKHPLQAYAGEPLVFPGRHVTYPDWRQLPVSGIAYDDAEAYTRWLAASGRLLGARICTEGEWEHAARGADGREFPSGDRLGLADANFDQTFGKNPDAFGPEPVGSHPQSRSPFGLDDMAGNEWEWTRSTLAAHEFVARGGSYYSSLNTCRSANRETPGHGFRSLVLGLRVCASFPAR